MKRALTVFERFLASIMSSNVVMDVERSLGKTMLSVLDTTLRRTCLTELLSSEPEGLVSIRVKMGSKLRLRMFLRSISLISSSVLTFPLGN